MRKRDAFRERQALGKQHANLTLWAGVRDAEDGAARFAEHVLVFSRGDSQMALKGLPFHGFRPAQVYSRQNNTLCVCRASLCPEHPG